MEFRAIQRVVVQALAFAVLVCAGRAYAQAPVQTYPAKPIRLLVPSSPGGGLDILARIITPSLTETLGTSVVVDNRAGASGLIALELAARAAPDGHTMVVFSAGQLIFCALEKTSFDLFRDFAPVSQVSTSPYALAVLQSAPYRSIDGLVAYAKANPGKLNYPSSGTGTLQHLAVELFGFVVGAKFVHVPYKGIGAALPDILAGRMQMTMASLTFLTPHARAKSLRVLAVTSDQRSAVLPEAPTMIEAGVPQFVVSQWVGVLMPARTPPPIIERMQREIRNAVQRPSVAAFLANDGTEAIGSLPRAFAAHMQAEDATWRKVIRQTGVRAE